MALGAVILGCYGTPEPATGETVEVVEPAEWSVDNGPAVSGKCMGLPIPPVALPEVPADVDREAYLDAYYETYARTFCEIRVSDSTLWA